DSRAQRTDTGAQATATCPGVATARRVAMQALCESLSVVAEPWGPNGSEVAKVAKEFDPAERPPQNVAEYRVWLGKVHGCKLTILDEDRYEVLVSFVRTNVGESAAWTAL